MTDLLLDDVKALLDKDFGDDRILKQIFRACKNDEVISNYEKNYVRKLAEKHLGRRSGIVQTKTPVEEKPIIPDVVIPKTPVLKTQIFQSKLSLASFSNLKNPKIMLGIGGIALVMIIALATSSTGVSGVNPTIEPPTTFIPTKLFIQTDLSLYDKKDIISISGISDIFGTVTISIKNQNNEPVWTGQVSTKSDGRYSTLVIAGGPGWENSGTYTIKVDNGAETNSSKFSFTA